MSDGEAERQDEGVADGQGDTEPVRDPEGDALTEADCTIDAERHMVGVGTSEGGVVVRADGETLSVGDAAGEGLTDPEAVRESDVHPDAVVEPETESDAELHKEAPEEGDHALLREVHAEAHGDGVAELQGETECVVHCVEDTDTDAEMLGEVVDDRERAGEAESDTVAHSEARLKDGAEETVGMDTVARGEPLEESDADALPETVVEKDGLPVVDTEEEGDAE